MWEEDVLGGIFVFFLIFLGYFGKSIGKLLNIFKGLGYEC